MLQDSQPVTYDPLLNFKVVSGALYSDSKIRDLDISIAHKDHIMALFMSIHVWEITQ